MLRKLLKIQFKSKAKVNMFRIHVFNPRREKLSLVVNTLYVDLYIAIISCGTPYLLVIGASENGTLLSGFTVFVHVTYDVSAHVMTSL